MREWTAEFLTALAALLGVLFMYSGKLFAWWERRRAERKKPVIKTVESLERTIAIHKEHIEALEDLYARSVSVTEQQDQRITRKDARIAHLEELLDRGRARRRGKD